MIGFKVYNFALKLNKNFQKKIYKKIQNILRQMCRCANKYETFKNQKFVIPLHSNI